MGSSFFARVMSFVPRRPGAFRPPPQKSMIKSKGKKPKAKGIEAAKDIDSLDVFSVVLNADAGGESSQQQADFFNQHLSELTETELLNLKKKIEKIRNAFFGSEDYAAMEHVDSFVRNAVDPRLEGSQKLLLDLCARITEKIIRLGLEPDESNGDKIKYLRFQGRNYCLTTIVKKHFSDELHEYNRLVKAGQVIPRRRKSGGTAFVAKTLVDYFQSQNV